MKVFKGFVESRLWLPRAVQERPIEPQLRSHGRPKKGQERARGGPREGQEPPRAAQEDAQGAADRPRSGPGEAQDMTMQFAEHFI